MLSFVVYELQNKFLIIWGEIYMNKDIERIKGSANQDIAINKYYINCKAMNEEYTNIYMVLDIFLNYIGVSIKPIKIELWVKNNSNEELITDIRCILTQKNESKITLETELENVQTWSAQIPNYYDFRMIVKDEEDSILYEEKFQYGFRFVDIKDGIMRINGQRIILNGIIFNDYKEDSTEILQEKYLEDIKIMKRNNINALITYDYNSAPFFYNMCNKYGIYVVHKPIPNQEQELSYSVEEIRDNIYKYNNYCCIIAWAIDNKLDISIDEYKNIMILDNSRPLYYEGDNMILKQRNLFEIKCDDIELDNENIEENPIKSQMAGKFLCEYIVQNNIVDEQINKGIIFGDRQINPYAYEIKKKYEMINIDAKDIIKGIFNIKCKYNKFLLNKYRFTWEILEDGIVIKKGNLLDVSNVEEQQIKIDYNMDQILENACYHININMITTEDTWWSPKEYVMAWSQYKIPYKVAKRKKNEFYKKIRVRDKKLKIEVIGDNYEIVIDKIKGNIRSIEFDQQEYILSPIKTYIEIQSEKFELSKVKEVIVNDVEKIPQIDVIRKCSQLKGYIITRYVIESDGQITIMNIIRSNNKAINVGMMLDVSGQFNDFSWFGKGPNDSYPEYNFGTKVGLYYYDLNTQIGKANKSDVIWGAFTNNEGEGILISTYKDILLNISPNVHNSYLIDQKDNENKPITLDVKCNSKSKHNIFGASTVDEDVYAFHIKRVI